MTIIGLSFCSVTAIFIFVYRYDRDNYIDILWSNVINGADDQFEKYGVNVIDQLNEPYDFGSIMVIKFILYIFYFVALWTLCI